MVMMYVYVAVYASNW